MYESEHIPKCPVKRWKDHLKVTRHLELFKVALPTSIPMLDTVVNNCCSSWGT